MDDEDSSTSQHVQVSFFTNDKTVVSVPDDVYDIPTNADAEQLNVLVNKSIQNEHENWEDRRFEFLIGETFLRTSLSELISEYEVETETVIKVECVLGFEAPKPVFDLQAPDWVSSVHVVNGFIFSTTYSGDLTIYDKKGEKLDTTVHSAKNIFKCSDIIKNPGKDLNGTEIIVGGENQLLSVYKIEKNSISEKFTFRGHERAVECVSVNDDGTRAVSGSFDTTIKVWNLEESETSTIYEKEAENETATKKRKKAAVTKVPMVTIGGHKDRVSSIGWCQWKPSHVLSSSWDNTIVEWDLELAGEVSRIKAQKAFTSIDIHPTSGLVIASSTDAIPRLYDPKSRDGVMVKQSFIGHAKGWVEQVAWNPNDEKCFVSVSTDQTAKMWDVRSGKTPLFDIHGHEDKILCCCWSKSGVIATGSADCTVKTFDACGKV